MTIKYIIGARIRLYEAPTPTQLHRLGDIIRYDMIWRYDKI